ncbi:hypothetical protein GGTG_04984 [Gaeumannomyces tritici R3-111a-1]|uniref:Uncharacterized protein n=1 Tax=Gaeumannomyces tritici (strain R3-111a-1) TaxID=644352 RepID=J3NUM8_GAET3|nr:hypothetical protein GGTG_04984 [Gaeumannomyces tritici R3-111a-1]EJT79902.1 hypothetical protein GGTG_04984 [Gaeumannomyces tritici R3-111a-1]
MRLSKKGGHLGRSEILFLDAAERLTGGKAPYFHIAKPAKWPDVDGAGSTVQNKGWLSKIEQLRLVSAPTTTRAA